MERPLDALELVENGEPFDVVVLDVMMPGMDGVEMLQALKASAEYRDIPVIMMSAAGQEVVPHDALLLLAGFLQKPFSFDELTAALDAALATR